MRNNREMLTALCPCIHYERGLPLCNLVAKECFGIYHYGWYFQRSLSSVVDEYPGQKTGGWHRSQRTIFFRMRVPPIPCIWGSGFTAAYPSSPLSFARLQYSSTFGSQVWVCSARYKSASRRAVATVTKHFLQIESIVPSRFRRRPYATGVTGNKETSREWTTPENR